MVLPNSTLIAAVRNDGPFLLEWVAYHRAIGFDRIVLFSDASADGSAALLQAMADAGQIDLIDNAAAGAGAPSDHRARAYLAALDTCQGWTLVLDTDEYLNIHAGDGTLSDLIAATPDADLISPMWRLFGQGEERVFTDAPILPRYVDAAPADKPRARHHTGIKTLFKAQLPISRLRPHRPELSNPDAQIQWVDGSGADVTDLLRTDGWNLPDRPPAYANAQINKYPLRSAEVFVLTNLWDRRWRLAAPALPLEAFGQLNAFEVRDRSIQRWSGAVAARIATLMANADIAAGHALTVTSYQAAIAQIHAEALPDWMHLWRSTPIYRPAERVAAKRPLPAPEDPETPQVEPMQGRAAEAVAETLAEAPKSAEPAEPDEETLLNMAPRWLGDLRRSEHRRGFYHSDEKFAAHFTDRGCDVLMVSFDNLSNVGDQGLTREGWGYSFYRDEGWSHMGVMAFERHWFRDEALFDYLGDLAARGFFKRFKQVVFTGTSMGAYASTAFCQLVPGSVALAFSPQSTLDTKLVPWEKRFGSGRKQDWSGRYRDAPDCIAEAGKVFILYDPYFEPDRIHAERYQGDNVHHLKCWYASHKSALFMNRAQILKPVVRAAADGSLTEAVYYKHYRERRNLPWYLNGLRDHLMDANHPKLVGRLAQFLINNGRPQLGQTMQKQLDNA
mgnify:CR=1 FL=1